MLASVVAFVNAVDPSHALFGAAVLFVLQTLAGGKLPDVSGFLKNLASKAATPTAPAATPASDHPVLDRLAKWLDSQKQ